MANGQQIAHQIYLSLILDMICLAKNNNLEKENMLVLNFKVYPISLYRIFDFKEINIVLKWQQQSSPFNK